VRERLLYSGKSLHLYNNLIYYAARSAVSGMAVVGEGGRTEVAVIEGGKCSGCDFIVLLSCTSEQYWKT